MGKQIKDKLGDKKKVKSLSKQPCISMYESDIEKVIRNRKSDK